MKSCTGCGITKPRDAFYTAVNGRPRSRCRDCYKADERNAYAIRRSRPPEPMPEVDTKPGVPPMSLTEYGKPDYAALGEEVCSTEILCCVCTRRTYASYSANARRDGREFSLTLAELTALITAPCTYCGQAPRDLMTVGEHKMYRNGIDRVDSSRGYVKGNVAPCCFLCNEWKRAMPASEFKAQILRMAARLEKAG